MANPLEQPIDLTADRTAPEIVDDLLRHVIRSGASDLYLLPTPEGLLVERRLDGVVAPLGAAPSAVTAQVVARIKVLAGLLTYETSIPQEGRIRHQDYARPIRVTTLPTVYGERVVARVLHEDNSAYGRLATLELPDSVAQTLESALRATSGMVLIAGPSGSGKTTTAYACLREVRERSEGGRSIVTIEDPVEVVLPGVAQSQVDLAREYDLPAALRALVRQDPEVIFVGEMRDQPTARLAYQAAMTGQLVLTTFHAADVAEAIGRLLDLGAPPSMMRAATRAVVSQRLLRRLCGCRSRSPGDPACDQCGGVGYRGRVAIAEAADLSHGELAESIESGYDRQHFARLRQSDQGAGLMEQAAALVRDGTTDQAEVERVLGRAC